MLIRSLCSLSIAALLGCSSHAKSEPDAPGSPSQFLSRCELGCGDGLFCLGGICSTSCLPGEDCAQPGAACRLADHEVPGPVCDVSCRDAADCSLLGEGYVCENHFCRASAPSASDCALYRSQSQDGLSIKLRNERASAIFLAPVVNNCTDSPHLVNVYSFGRYVYLENPDCSVPSCEDVRAGTPAGECADTCRQRRLVRLNAGAEMELGTFRSQFLRHGVAPASCAPYRDVEQPCIWRAPLAPGPYDLVAGALSDCRIGEEFGMAGSCECENDDSSGSCTTRAFLTSYSPPGGVGTSARVELSAGEVTLVFH